MSKKVLFLPQTSELAPAAGFRIYQYLPYLKRYNIDFSVLPSVEREHHSLVYGNKKNIFSKIFYYTKSLIYRSIHYRDFLKYDCVFFQKETFPYMYPLAEKIIAANHPNTVFDFDDAVFLKYKHSGFFKKMLPLFTTVIVGNKYLYDYAVKYNKNTIIIPTTIDTDLYTKKIKEQTPRINIGWSGSLTTNKYLNALNEPLKYLFEKYPNLKLTIISNSLKNINLDLPTEKINFIEWNYQNTVKDLTTIDIGLMPLPLDMWSQGKCALKLLQYMSLNIPAVCSPTKANSDVIIDGENGFMATENSEWIKKIERLITDKNLYAETAKKARETVKEKYSTALWLSKIIAIINN